MAYLLILVIFRRIDNHVSWFVFAFSFFLVVILSFVEVIVHAVF